jgi:hypothetical protein
MRATERVAPEAVVARPNVLDRRALGVDNLLNHRLEEISFSLTPIIGLP